MSSMISDKNHNLSSTQASDSLIFPRQVGGDKRGVRHGSSIVKSKCEKSSSIPSKFSTTLFERSRMSGFMSSANRFGSVHDYSYSQADDPLPGPGNYEQGAPYKIGLIGASPSFSKKGYGMFCSQAQSRSTTFEMNRGPGPGNYGNHYSTMGAAVTLPTITSSCINKNAGKLSYNLKQHHTGNYNSYNKYLNYMSKEFKFEIDRNRGPGTYEVKNTLVAVSDAKNAGPNLQSKQEREFDYANEIPGPGEYNLNRALVKQKPYPHIGPLSSFAGTVHRHKINLRDPKDMRKQLDQDLIKKKKVTLEDLKIPSPGPGEYDDIDAFDYMKSYKPDNALGSKAFIQDDHDKFGNNIHKEFNEELQDVIIPGPGAYEEVREGFATDKVKEKALVSGAVFLSESEREPFGKMKPNVAPNKYNPNKLPSAISFHFNVQNKWV